MTRDDERYIYTGISFYYINFIYSHYSFFYVYLNIDIDVQIVADSISIPDITNYRDHCSGDLRPDCDVLTIRIYYITNIYPMI